jgi:hypothetical protein
MKTLALILISILFIGCSDQTLSVSVTKNPIGGTSVRQVTADYKGAMKSGGLFGLASVKPIDIKVEWMWQDFYRTRNQVMRSDIITFDTDGETTKSTSYNEVSGYVLANYYYLRLSWSDDAGSHSVESAKAYCK